MPNIAFSDILQRLLRQDDVTEVGASTLKAAFAALDSGDTEEAKRQDIPAEYHQRVGKQAPTNASERVEAPGETP